MKHRVTLTKTSVLSILFFATHWVDDIVRGISPGGGSGHMRGAGVVCGRIANSSGVFFWVWTLIALGVSSTFSPILSPSGLWSLRRRQSR